MEQDIYLLALKLKLDRLMLNLLLQSRASCFDLVQLHLKLSRFGHQAWLLNKNAVQG